MVDETPVQLGREVVDLAGQLGVGLELQFLVVEVVIRLGPAGTPPAGSGRS